jgi:hypothetical protein
MAEITERIMGVEKIIQDLTTNMQDYVQVIEQ